MDTMIDEELFRPSRVEPWQAELVTAACRSLEHDLREAGTPAAARAAVAAACGSFDAECGSSLLRAFLRRHAEALMRRYWKTI